VNDAAQLRAAVSVLRAVCWCIEGVACYSKSLRLFFTTFPHSSPSADTLNDLYGEGLEPPPVRHLGSGAFASTSAAAGKVVPHYFFTLDHTLLYNSFYLDWGPLNLAMVYKACLLIHELLSVRVPDRKMIAPVHRSLGQRAR
jgi:hypothetical protein